jgi:hypothetical protein
MTLDFRALCAELHAAFTTYAVDECHHNLLERARAALAEAVPDGREQVSFTEQPSDKDLDKLLVETDNSVDLSRAFARAVLARWGNPAPQPVPVSECLPEPKDCDEEGRCWVWWKNGVRWVLDEWTHHELREGPLSDYVSHWLPAHALPLPDTND